MNGGDGRETERERERSVLQSYVVIRTAPSRMTVCLAPPFHAASRTGNFDWRSPGSGSASLLVSAL